MTLTRWLGIALLLAAAPMASGWGRDGHILIARLASRHLNAKARAEVARLLGQGVSLESVSLWADEIRGERKDTAPWHYINMSITAQRGDWRQYCPDTGCVPGAVAGMFDRLRDRSMDHAKRVEALKFLVHFAGDMHNPLHAGDRGDRGGNDVQVVFLDKPANLHSIWDTPILANALERDKGLADRLTAPAKSSERKRLQQGTLDDWIWQARDLSRDVAYANLATGRPAALGAEYQAKAQPVIELQIRRAGLRLAKLLNDAIGR